jgi:tRNA threonylcarbamoyladenosine biosynthesis protein TsaB
VPSLRQLLAAHAPLLLIDAASARIQVGWLTAGGSTQWKTSDEESGIGVFRCVEQLGVEIGTVGGFVFCEGPGSMLGIRTVAMALRTWGVVAPRPMFSYQSLALIAHALGRSELQVIADARRDSWHVFKLGDRLRRVPTAALTGAIALPENFRTWSALPAISVERVPYSLPEILPRIADVDVFQPTDAPDAFLHEEPSYVTWTPQIHRAP